MAELFESQNEERTESATQHRRDEVRRQGMVALSREVLSVSVLGAVGASLYIILGRIPVGFHQFSETFFQFDRLDEISKAKVLEMATGAVTTWLRWVAPAFGMAMAAGILASSAQVGFYFTTEPLQPKWDRLDPIKGFQKLVSLQGASEAVKAIIKLVIVVWISWIFIKGQSAGLGNLIQMDLSSGISSGLSMLSKLFFLLLGALAVFAAGDYALQKFRLEKQIRMSRREIKEEFKLREGDPMIKARIRGIQRRMLSRRMMEEVPKSDVVVTNPTHYAVALKYDGTMVAPKVVAKGVDYVALKIREAARSAGVPIVENKPLARALHKEIEVGQTIPKELYKAVAEVLSYVYRLKMMTA